jgi:hypothetical protein
MRGENRSSGTPPPPPPARLWEGLETGCPMGWRTLFASYLRMLTFCWLTSEKLMFSPP